jgi:hypothetical protein
MYKLVLVGTIMASAFAHIHPINEHIIEEIKQKAKSWKPMEIESNPLHHMTIEQVQGLLGSHDALESVFPASVTPVSYAAGSAFDAREKWGSCVHPIRD